MQMKSAQLAGPHLDAMEAQEGNVIFPQSNHLLSFLYSNSSVIEFAENS